jgi:hypothetical protein
MIDRLLTYRPRLDRLLVAGSVALVGCGTVDREAGARSMLTEELEAIRVSEAAVTIGSGAEASSTLDRVFGGALLAGGEIAVGNSGSGEVRVFDDRGRHLRTTGRPGAGPGEFRSINWMGRMGGDSVLVWDLAANRFSVLDPEARFVRTFLPDGLFGPVHPEGVLEDGSIVVSVGQAPDPRTQQGVARDSIRLVRISPAGALIDEIATLPGSEWLHFTNGSSFRTLRLPLGRQTHAALAGSGTIVHGSSESARLYLGDASSSSRRRIDLPLRQPDISPRTRRAIIEQEYADPESRGVLARVPPDPSGHPVFTDLVGDGAGRVWIRVFTDPGIDRATWLVVSSDRDRPARIELPASARPLDIRDDRLLLREIDGDGVHHVTVREIRR